MKVTGRVIDVKRNIDVLLYNHCCSGRSISITNCESVFVALVTQHAKRMSHIILSPIACLAPPYLSTLSYKGTIFEGENRYLNICVSFAFHCKFVWDMYKENSAMYYHTLHRSAYKLRVILVRV